MTGILCSMVGAAVGLPGSTASNPATSSSEVATYHSVSGVYWINPNTGGWTTAKRCWVDVTRNGGGWMLWAAGYGSTGMDIRSYFGGSYSTNNELTERTAANTTGHQPYVWDILTGSSELWWVNNISGQSATSAGSYVTSVIHASENGTAMNSSENFWNMVGGTTSCPASSRRYNYSVTSVASGWWNDNSSMGVSCSGFGWAGSQYVGNYIASGDCYACYSPHSVLFGNGASGYYSYGNSYDYDFLGFNLGSAFYQTGIPSHVSNSNQVWVRW